MTEQHIYHLNSEKELGLAAGLFEGWDETMIWSCLQNVMGKVFAHKRTSQKDGRIEILSAAAALGDFLFFAGKPDEELITYGKNRLKRDFIILVPRHEGWMPLIEKVYGEKARKVTRYATLKDPAVFDEERVQALSEMACKLPHGYALRPMDNELYHACLSHPWSKDLVSQFETFEQFLERGLGVCALKDGELTAGASTYSAYRTGIEIEVDTREDHRRRGLAKACAASLILACLKRNLYPSWDAHNPGSLALAQKLGYRPSGAYTAYEVVTDGEVADGEVADDGEDSL